MPMRTLAKKTPKLRKDAQVSKNLTLIDVEKFFNSPLEKWPHENEAHFPVLLYFLDAFTTVTKVLNPVRAANAVR